MVLAVEPCAVCALVVFLLGLVSVGVLCCSVLVGVPADETARYLYCLVLLGVLYGVKCQIAFLLAVTLLLHLRLCNVIVLYTSFALPLVRVFSFRDYQFGGGVSLLQVSDVVGLLINRSVCACVHARVGTHFGYGSYCVSA